MKSLFKRRRGPEGAVCRRGHTVREGTPAPCDAGHGHVIYMCQMRVGSRRCGLVWMQPAMGGGCDDPTRAEL